jgi:hypothetical protein
MSIGDVKAVPKQRLGRVSELPKRDLSGPPPDHTLKREEIEYYGNDTRCNTEDFDHFPNT